jgi:hypothetical protein
MEKREYFGLVEAVAAPSFSLGPDRDKRDAEFLPTRSSREDTFVADGRASGERADTSVELGRVEMRYLAEDVDPLRPLASAALGSADAVVSDAEAALKNSVSLGIATLIDERRGPAQHASPSTGRAAN